MRLLIGCVLLVVLANSQRLPTGCPDGEQVFCPGHGHSCMCRPISEEPVAPRAFKSQPDDVITVPRGERCPAEYVLFCGRSKPCTCVKQTLFNTPAPVPGPQEEVWVEIARGECPAGYELDGCGNFFCRCELVNATAAVTTPKPTTATPNHRILKPVASDVVRVPYNKPCPEGYRIGNCGIFPGGFCFCFKKPEPRCPKGQTFFCPFVGPCYCLNGSVIVS